MRIPSSTLLESYHAGDAGAAEELYQRYAPALWALAKKQIGDHLRPHVEADDILQSAFRSFFRHAAKGAYQVDHSGALWRLLVQITLNKIRDAANRVPPPPSPGVAAVSAGPDHRTEMADVVEVALADFDDRDRRIVWMALEYYTSVEIAGQLNITRWTVRRVLNRFGERLRRALGSDCAESREN